MRKLIITLLVCAVTPVFISGNIATTNVAQLKLELPEASIDLIDTRALHLFNVQLYLLQAARAVAEEHKVPVPLVYALIQKESSWRPRVISPKNSNGSRDYGLMQLSSSNFEMFEWKYQPKQCYTTMDLYDNLDAGIRYLLEQYRRFGSWEAAVAAYNCGPNRYKTGKIPESTKKYVEDIFSMIKLLEGE